MSVSLYDISITPFIHHLKTLQVLLEKGVAHTKDGSNTLTEEALLNSRLIADMGNLVFQTQMLERGLNRTLTDFNLTVQRASDTSKGVAVRVGQVPPRILLDEEKTFPELQERLANTIAMLESVDKELFDKQIDAEVVLTQRSGDKKYTAQGYLTEFAIPNFYFHFVTAYALLRKEGVQVGKKDYLG